jgi:hypothetical protein
MRSFDCATCNLLLQVIFGAQFVPHCDGDASDLLRYDTTFRPPPDILREARQDAFVRCAGYHLLQVHFGSSGIIISPSTSVLAPVIRGEPDMAGLLLGSRELLCFSSRISRTLVSCSSLSELYLPGESVSCQIQGESVGWWSNIIYCLARRGVFRGARQVTSTSRHSGARHVKSAAYRYRGSTCHVVAA